MSSRCAGDVRYAGPLLALLERMTCPSCTVCGGHGLSPGAHAIPRRKRRRGEGPALGRGRGSIGREKEGESEQEGWECCRCAVHAAGCWSEPRNDRGRRTVLRRHAA